MARGDEGCRLVKDEGLEAAIVEELVKFCQGGEGLKDVAQGQPFRLSLMEALLKEAGDGDYEFLDEAKAGLPLGVKSQLPMTKPRAPFPPEIQMTPLSGMGNSWRGYMLETSTTESLTFFDQHESQMIMKC